MPRNSNESLCHSHAEFPKIKFVLCISESPRFGAAGPLAHFLTSVRREEQLLKQNEFPISELEQRLAPLLQFMPDPRKQYWYADLLLSTITYMGEYDKHSDAADKLLELNGMDQCRRLLLDANLATALLRSARVCHAEYELKFKSGAGYRPPA